MEHGESAMAGDDARSRFHRDGFLLAGPTLDDATLDVLCASCGGEGGAGRRNLLRDVPAVRGFVDDPRVAGWVGLLLGPGAFCVRALWFDKNPAANWRVPWHQDTAIAVRERRELPGCHGWSTKEGVPHVHPPVEILSRMLVLRWHLDACGADNGPLRVLPGSHRAGRLDGAGIARWRRATRETTCLVARGGLLAMRPLLLHASSPALCPSHRRVLHFEFAVDGLPGGLEWHDRVGAG